MSLADILSSAIPGYSPTANASPAPWQPTWGDNAQPVATPTPDVPQRPPSAWDIIPHMLAGKSMPDAAAAAQAQFAPPPQPVQSNHLGDVLDSLFTDGAFRKTRDAAYARQVDAYQRQVTYQIANSIKDPNLRAAYLANPGKYGEEIAKNLAPVTRSAGQETQFGENGPIVGTNTTQIDPVSGRVVTMAPSGESAAGPSLGGGYDATTGVSSRTGAQVPVVTMQKTAPGESVGPVAPPLGINIAPGIPPQYTGGGFPAPGDIAKALPGARITSGLRTPAQNAAVGGVPNSQHLNGQAYDLVPAPGETLPQLAARASAAFPGAKVLVEGPGAANSTGPHVHIAAGQRLAAASGIPSSIQGRALSPPVWNPATNQFEQTGFDGKVTSTGTPPFSPEKLRDTVLQHEDYKQATAAMGAYKAMTANAGQMTGPGAYSMLDTFARAINPGAVARPTVIQTLEHSLGPLNSVPGGWDRVLGQGNLTPKVRQQILDSVYGFVQAHHGQAQALNDQNAAIAARYGMDPRNVTAPLEALPAPFKLGAQTGGAPDPKLPTATPNATNRAPGLYNTPKGVLKWTGQAWQAP